MPEARNEGIWIRRVTSPAARQRRLVVRAEDKENVPPFGAGRMRLRRRSPLPEWYPRTPLRDITAIVNAIERRRHRVQAARAAQGNTDNPASRTNPSPAAADDSTPHCITLSPVDNPLPTPSPSSTSSSFSPTYSTPTTKVQPADTEFEDKLCRSIEQIERIVMKNLKTIKKDPITTRAKQRQILMSMR